MKRIKRAILNWIAEYNLKKLKKEADRLHIRTGKQYLIIPVDNWTRGEYVIVNNEAHKAYNKEARKLGRPQINFVELCKIAVYKTPAGRL